MTNSKLTLGKAAPLTKLSFFLIYIQFFWQYTQTTCSISLLLLYYVLQGKEIA